MSNFARKYRSNDLDSYIGNEDIKSTLKNYLSSGKRPQTMLITGPSGCGKTTVARVITKIYNCEEGGNEPCNHCSMCQAFDDYIKTGNDEFLPDIKEIDASDGGSKKDIDAMLSDMEYPPIASPWKAYIVDEAHLISDAGMGRLLKSLEEPPENVLIILCTTNPEELLDTIRNRCQVKLQVKKPSTQDIMGLLEKVCLLEGKDFDLNGLRMIASFSDHVVRDSLNNLELVVSTRGTAKAEDVSLQLSQVSDKIIFDFFRAYQEEDYVGYINVLYTIKTNFDLKQAVSTTVAFITRGIYILNGVNVEGLSEEETKLYVNLFKKFSSKELSTILSGFLCMDKGDIEANLMAFIYTKNTPSELNSTSSICDSSITLESEKVCRNDNLERIERAKLEAGLNSVSHLTNDVTVNRSVKDFFNMKKIE